MWILAACALTALSGLTFRSPQGAYGSSPAAPTHARLELLLEQPQLAAGESQWIALRWRIEPGWHLYWLNPGEAGLEPRWRLDLPPGLELSPWIWPVPSWHAADGLVSLIYERELVLMARLSAARDLPTGSRRLSVRADWLACQEACEPESGQAQQTLEIVAPKAPVSSPASGGDTPGERPKPAGSSSGPGRGATDGPQSAASRDLFPAPQAEPLRSAFERCPQPSQGWSARLAAPTAGHPNRRVWSLQPPTDFNRGQGTWRFLPRTPGLVQLAPAPQWTRGPGEVWTLSLELAAGMEHGSSLLGLLVEAPAEPTPPTEAHSSAEASPDRPAFAPNRALWLELPLTPTTDGPWIPLPALDAAGLAPSAPAAT